MYQEGYFTGVTDIYAADMTTEDTPPRQRPMACPMWSPRPSASR